MADIGPRFSTTYRLASFLAHRLGVDTLIDVGCASATDLIRAHAGTTLVIDRPAALAPVRRMFTRERLLAVDEAGVVEDLAPAIVEQAVVVAADVDLHATTSPVLTLLSTLAARAAATIVATRAGQTATADCRERLRALGLAPTFVGLTASDGTKDSCIAIVDRLGIDAGVRPPDSFRPLALLNTFNDEDIILEVLATLLDDGMDVRVIDNWSTDRTWPMLRHLADARPALTLERFPPEGPSQYFELQALMRRKQDLVAEQHDRWLIHQDSDEIRETPWPGMSLRTGLFLAQRAGYNAVDFTVCEFRPVEAQAEGGLVRGLPYFEFAPPSPQVKAWRQQDQRIDMSTTAGHDVQFDGRRVFPYNFVLRHYSLRNPDQARRKITEARRARYPPHERALLWHTHNDRWSGDDPFVWSAAELFRLDAADSRDANLVELISEIGIDRQESGSVRAAGTPGDAGGLAATSPTPVPTEHLEAGLSPASFMDFGHAPITPWLPHGPLLAWLIDAIRPRSIVVTGPDGAGAIGLIRLIVEALRLPTTCVAAETPTVVTGHPDLMVCDPDVDAAQWTSALAEARVVVARGDGAALPGTRATFPQHGGVAIAVPSGEAPDPLRPLMASAAPSAGSALCFAYERLGESAVERATRTNARRLASLKDAAMDAYVQDEARQTARLETTRAELQERITELGRTTNQLLAARDAAAQIHADLAQLRGSASWRLTRPMRWIRRRAPRVARVLRRLARLEA